MYSFRLTAGYPRQAAAAGEFAADAAIMEPAAAEPAAGRYADSFDVAVGLYAAASVDSYTVEGFPYPSFH